ncbi:MAG: HAMP domain-containing sensor histidine kinase, partial [Myxococcota bacterium]
SVLLAIMLAALLGWPLSTRIGQATSYARHVANGNYDAVLPTGQQDEMGVLVATLRDAANELRRTDERRREFLANIAHELRTPVTSIRGFAETLLSTGSGPNKAQEFLPVIHRNALRIGKLVDDLLELEAIEAGGTPVSKETFLLEPLAHTVAKTLEQLAEDSGVTLEVEVPSDVEVTADPEALERILLNLADNAVRHGGGCVRLQAESRTRSTVVSVSDEGEGIPPEERSVVFERFQRGSHARRTGTGLGLAIARQLAHSLDATLRLVPTTQGTRFELEMSRG